jgi:hypothetical protein
METLNPYRPGATRRGTASLLPRLSLVRVISLFLLFSITTASHAAELLLSDDFESGNLSKWAESSDSITQQVVHAGKYALKYNGWPGTWGNLSKPSTDVYLSMWIFYPQGFDWQNKPGRHYWRLNYGDSSKPNVYSLDVTTAAEYRGYQFDFFLGNGEQIFTTAENVLPQGKWFQMEFHIKLNDKGQSNGLLEMWVDKQPVLLGKGWDPQTLTRIEGIDFKWKQAFNNLMLTTNYDGCSSSRTECTWYIDDVQVWDGCPPGSACGLKTTPTPLPAAVWMMVPALVGLARFRRWTPAAGQSAK